MTSGQGQVGFRALPVDLAAGSTQVWLEEEDICWDPDARDAGERKATDGLLDAFLRIDDAEGVLQFAGKWGAIWFCQAHNLPVGHALIRASAFEWYEAYETEAGECFPDRVRSPHRDPVERYLHFAARARSILRIAAELHTEREGSREDWMLALTTFFPEEWWQDAETVDSYIAGGRMTLGDLVSEWMRVGAVLPYLDWNARDPAFTFRAGTFGVIGVQILQAVSRAHEIAFCSSCSRPYLRQGRKPQAGRRNYCPDCGPRAWLRDAQRDYQARKRKHGQKEG